MADELRITLDFTAEKGFSTGRKLLQQKFDIAGDVYASGTISVGTSDEQLDLGDVTSVGYAFFHNLDDTNYIQIAPDDGAAAASDYMIRLRPGQFGLMPLEPGADLFAKANTAACLMHFIVLSA